MSRDYNRARLHNNKKNRAARNSRRDVKKNQRILSTCAHTFSFPTFCLDRFASFSRVCCDYERPTAPPASTPLTSLTLTSFHFLPLFNLFTSWESIWFKNGHSSKALWARWLNNKKKNTGQAEMVGNDRSVQVNNYLKCEFKFHFPQSHLLVHWSLSRCSWRQPRF